MRKGRAEQIVAEVAAGLKACRKAAGFSHNTLAKMVGVSRPAISHIENGKRKPSLLLAIRIACMLKISLADLLRDIESRHPMC